MTKPAYILALDQGTTSSRAILFNRQGQAVAQANCEFQQIYPRPGWVEHNPEEIWSSQVDAARRVLQESGATTEQIAAIGITNQRETTLLWERGTGRPLHNAIVWQCRRTADYCTRLIEKGHGASIQEKTGLVVDAYFSGSKLRWFLENIDGARRRAEQGDLCFGTVDTWILHRLTNGKVHATDASNASRTMLYNLHENRWDPDMLRLFEVPAAVLPEVRPSSARYGLTASEWFGREIPIASMVGDQQAALFGQCCFDPGSAKNTYGTGCFLLLNTGRQPVRADRLLTTVAWNIDGETTYALEGSVFIAGAAIQWLRDELKIIQSAGEVEAMALSVADNAGVYFVPALVGLGAPHWDMYARGTIVGLTRGTGRNHLARAALEAIAYQTGDVLHAMEEQSGIRLQRLRVDGGAASNNFLCQFQADILGVPVERPQMKETTALGAAYLAGLAVGFWKDFQDISGNWQLERDFHPNLVDTERRRIQRGWQMAVQRALGWEKVVMSDD